jgi:hypothetical protein
VALLLLATVALAQSPDAREAMTRTVLEQLEAFRRGDWATAYGYASAAIQGRFGLEAFRRMVVQGYGPIAHSVVATVARAEVVDQGRGFVEVRIEGADGETVDAFYELVEERGAWRINGVLTSPVDRGLTATGPPTTVRPRPAAG